MDPNSPLVAIVGGDTLLGRELRGLLDDKPLPARVKVAGGAVVPGEEGDESPGLTTLELGQLEGVTVAFLTGSPASARRAARLASEMQDPPVLVDLTYALEDRPSARLRAPALEGAIDLAPGTIHIVAHPAATALAMLFQRLREYLPVKHSVAQVFEPASERGQRGLDELQQQTVALLSFRPLSKDFYDAQIGFNLLPRYGCEAMEALEDVEARIESHLATLLANSSGHSAMPSLRLVQAPVFHGYSISLWVEFDSVPVVEDLERALAGHHIDVRTREDEPPNNVGAAGQGGLIAGVIEQDRSHPRAVWIWVAADNLLLMAESAREAVRRILESHA